MTKNAKLNNKDYQIFDNSGKVIREGNFKKTDFGWSYDDNLDKNYQKDNSFNTLRLKYLNSSKIMMDFKDDSFVSSKADLYLQRCEKFLKDFEMITKLGFKEQIKVHIFNSPEEKTNAQKSYQRSFIKEIFVVYNKNNDEFTSEASKMLLQINSDLSNDKLFEKAFIEFAKDLGTDKLKSKNKELLQKNKMPSLLKIIRGDITNDQSPMILGSFSRYLIEKYGMESYQEVMLNAKNLEDGEVLSNISTKISTSFSRLEREWHYYLNDK